MTARIVLILALLAAVPGWSQTTGTGNGTDTGTNTGQNTGTNASTDEQPDQPVANDGMLTPPPVSGEAYPVLTGAEERSNFLVLGVAANVAYDDNVEGGYTGVSKGDMIYSLWPTVSLNRSSLRLNEKFNYSPGFTFYQPSTVFNAYDQNATGNLQYLMGTHTNLTVQDNFDKSSSLFSQPFAGSQGTVSGGVPTQTTGAVAPFADRILNTANLELTNQAGDNGKFGLTASYQNLDYPNPKEVTGLYNGTDWEGGAFATQRVTRQQYLGANVQHARIVSYLSGGTDNVMQRDNIFGFYTIYLRNVQQNTLSISFSGGPEHYTITQYPQALLSKWTPAGTASLGWQGHRSSASANISRAVTGGGGLPGAFLGEGGQAIYRRQLRPTWDINISTSYTLNKSATPQYAFSVPGGHTIGAGGSADHMLSRNLKIAFGYDWMDQSYKSVVSLNPIPISNREYGLITYEFTRPIGR